MPKTPTKPKHGNWATMQYQLSLARFQVQELISQNTRTTQIFSHSQLGVRTWHRSSAMQQLHRSSNTYKLLLWYDPLCTAMTSGWVRTSRSLSPRRSLGWSANRSP